MYLILEQLHTKKVMVHLTSLMVNTRSLFPIYVMAINCPRQLEHWSLNLGNFSTKLYSPYEENLLPFHEKLYEFTISNNKFTIPTFCVY